MVFNDEINSPICPHCNTKTKIANAPLLYHDAKKLFAVWYEPEYDANIEKECEEYAKMFGPDSYLAKPPRIKDWEEFKNTIRKFEKGVLKADPGEISPAQAGVISAIEI